MSLIETLNIPGLYAITDTLENDGTGFILQLLKQIAHPSLFLSSSGNSAHYSALFKKYQIDPIYLEYETAWNSEDFPLLEEPPSTWQNPKNSTKIDSLLKKIEKFSSRTQVIVIDNIYPLYCIKGTNFCLQLIYSLKLIYPFVIVKIPEAILPHFWQLEESSDTYIEIKELESGYSTEYSGRIKIFQRQSYVKEEIGNFWFQLKQNNFQIIEN